MSRPVENFYGLVVMDNYDLSNLSFLGECADSGEHHSWLTDEQNKQATFLGRSATATTPEQPELQQRLLTDEEQLSEQRVLADFDISLLPSTRDLAKFDESEDPFAALAAYQSPSFEGDSQPPPLTANWAWARVFSKASLLKNLPMLYWPNQKGMIFLSYQCSRSICSI